MKNTDSMPNAGRARITVADVAIEFFSTRDNAMFCIACATLIFLGMTHSPRWTDVLWFLAGWAIFLPQEWLTHVYILHWKIIPNERCYLWAYRLHFGHHDFPRRHDLMFMPLWLTLPMVLLNLAVFFAIAGDARDALAGFAGALAGYMVFEWSHLVCHVPLIPSSRLWRVIRDRHLAHHYVNEHHWHSVSPPAQFIDRLLGTSGERQSVERSGTGRFLLKDLDPAWIEKARGRFAGHSNGDLEQSSLWLRHAALRRVVPAAAEST